MKNFFINTCQLVLTAILFATAPASAQNYAPGVSVTPVSPGYHTLNIASFLRQNLLTVGTTQYIAFYGVNTNVTVGRRTLGTTNWEFYASNLKSYSSTDGHNIISMGVSGDSVLHCSWGMHNNNLNYARTAPGSLVLVQTNMTGAENSVTYPQFIQCPNGDELFIFREGGSGAGDTYMNRWSSTTHSWTNVNYSGGQKPFIKGTTGNSATDCNAYPNFEGFDSKTNLHATWTWREDASAIAWNHDTLYARTPDYGATWQTWTGANYTLPITKATADNIWPIATNHEIMNQSGQCIDTNDRPVICNWWAPNGGGTPIQYFVIWNDGTQWRTNQMWTRSTTNWPTRPLIVCDKSNRLLVFYTDNESGKVPRIAWCSDPNRAVWNFASLSSDVMNGWEFDHNPTLWQREGKLHFFYQPNYGNPTTGKQISVMEFDPGVFFSNLPPVAMSFDWSTNSGPWSGPPNWTNLTAPPVNGGTNLALNFRGSSFYSASNDLPGVFALNSLTLNNSAAVTNRLTGNPLVFRMFAAIAPSLVHSGAASFTISNAVSLTDPLALQVAGPGGLSLAGNLSGSGVLSLSGGGNVALSSSNSFTGGITLNGATVKSVPGGFGSGNFIYNSGTIGWLSGVPCDFSAGHATTFNATPTLDPNGNDVTLAGVISGAGGLTFNASVGGSLALAGSNTYAGVTTVNAGLLIAGSPNALGSVVGNTVVAGNFATSSLGIQGNIATDEPLRFGGRQPLPNASGLAAHLINSGGTNTLSGVITCDLGGNQYNLESAGGLLIVAGSWSQVSGTGSRFYNLQGAGDGRFDGQINKGTGVIYLTA